MPEISTVLSRVAPATCSAWATARVTMPWAQPGHQMWGSLARRNWESSISSVGITRMFSPPHQPRLPRSCRA